MPSSRCRVLSAVLAAAVLAALCADAGAQKLYRWTDKDGKVHYSDSIPPEAVESARDELNRQGQVSARIERAMTEEERAAARAEAAAEAERQRIQAEQDKHDSVLLASYSTEAELTRSYQERFDLVDQSVQSAQTGIQSQQKSLADLLAHAAELERQGKPVPAGINSSIALARRQVAEQQGYLDKRVAERKSLHAEYDSTLARYRAVKAKREQAETAAASEDPAVQ